MSDTAQVELKMWTSVSPCPVADPEAAPDEELAEVKPERVMKAKWERVGAKERTAVRDAARDASPAPASLIGNISAWVTADRMSKSSGEVGAAVGAGVKRGAAVFLLIPLILGRGLHSFRFQLNLSSSVHRVAQLHS